MEHMDERADQVQIDENLDPVKENLDEHKDSDKDKWEKVFSRLDDLTKRLDGFEQWVNEAIGGIDKTEADDAKDTANDAEEYDVANLDEEFYNRQKRYLEEGGY